MSLNILDDQKGISLAALRKSYTKYGLSEEALPQDPFVLFRKWLTEALESEVTEPNAMNLSTVSPEGNPNGRMVLLKGIEDGSLIFYTNYSSQKGEDIKIHPNVSCTFWWAELERQVRISGLAELLSEDKSDQYFKYRPRESQIGAWASNQSSQVHNRHELEKRFQEAEKRFEGKEIPRPEYWGGYKIKVQNIEFWQGRPGRLHDRMIYQVSGNGWTLNRLSP